MPAPKRTASSARKPAAGTRRASASKSAPARSRAAVPARRRSRAKSAPPVIRLPINPLAGLSAERKIDIAGVILTLIGLLTLLSLLSTEQGSVTNAWVGLIRKLAGQGAFVLPAVLILFGVWLVLRNVERLPVLRAERSAGLVLLYLNALAWLHLASGGGWELADAGAGGGWLGAFFERMLVGALGKPGAIVALAAWSLVAVALTLDVSISQLFAFFQNGLAAGARRVNQRLQHEQQQQRQRAAHNTTRDPGLTQRLPAAAQEPISELPPDFEEFGAPGSAAGGGQSAAQAAAKRAAARAPRADGAVSPSATQPGRAVAPSSIPATAAAALPPWATPAVAEMLEPGEFEAKYDEKNDPRAQVIEQTLKSFGAPVQVVATNRGPTVTQFGVKPLYLETRNGQVRVRVSKIAALADDLALALAAPRIRIQAPVPGREYVGIEVPNIEVSRVMLRDVMESDAYRKLKSPLRFALGKDVSGTPRCYDLAAMPHLLIAGTTGSGKSVLVNAILSSFLINNSPTDLRMILVDPKRVELTGYNGIPHLISPVVVDLEKTTSVLNWTAREMDSRYRMFAKHGVRNIVDFNTKVTASAGKTNDPELQRRLPYIILVIDELADLMMMAPDETEKVICRLAQMARATGIHLILATQRPSVDVVTGLIKANFPARIAFTVATTVDSRVILDGPGAEKLLGRGDMLVVTPEQSMPMRAQGCFLNEKEITRVVRHWRAQLGQNAGADPVNTAMVAPSLPMKSIDAEPAVLPTPDLFSTPNTWDEARALEEAAKDVGGGGNKDDKLFNDAVATVRLQGKASISLLQRRLRIGYTRAARLIEEMEERGIVGPQVAGQQHREVLNSPLNGTEA